MPKFCIIMRGISGSGKSTTAQLLWNDLHENNIVCDTFGADQYFYKNVEGFNEPQYIFEQSQLGKAHALCRENFTKSQAYCVIIDNTNCSYNEMKFYMDYCMKHQINLLFCTVDKFKSDEELYNENVHGVPLDVIQRQKQKFTPTYEVISKYIVEYKKHFDNIEPHVPHEEDLC